MGICYNIEELDSWLRPYVIQREISRIDNRTGKEQRITYYQIGIIPISEMIKHNLNPFLKWKVSGVCIHCGETFTSVWNNLCHRKKHAKEEFCGKCLRKEQFTEEWRRKNSEAQKRVQGTSEARRHMSQILKKKHQENPSLKKKISAGLKTAYKNNDAFRRKISEASKRNWENPDYQTKVTGNSFYHGYYKSKFGEIFFASSWELFFLEWCDTNPEVTSLKRSKERIEYTNTIGSHSRYLPDFEVTIKNKEFVFEIKGKINMVEIENKRLAAEKFFNGKKTYCLLFKQDLQRLGIEFGKSSFNKKLRSLLPKIRDGKIGQESIDENLTKKGF